MGWRGKLQFAVPLCAARGGRRRAQPQPLRSRFPVAACSQCFELAVPLLTRFTFS